MSRKTGTRVGQCGRPIGNDGHSTAETDSILTLVSEVYCFETPKRLRLDYLKLLYRAYGMVPGTSVKQP